MVEYVMNHVIKRFLYTADASKQKYGKFPKFRTLYSTFFGVIFAFNAVVILKYLGNGK